MNVQLTLGGLAAIFGMLSILSAFAIWVIKSVVKDVINEALKALDDKYVQAKGSALTGHEIENRLNKVEAVALILQAATVAKTKEQTGAD